jgi:hypothetical protein
LARKQRQGVVGPRRCVASPSAPLIPAPIGRPRPPHPTPLRPPCGGGGLKALRLFGSTLIIRRRPSTYNHLIALLTPEPEPHFGSGDVRSGLLIRSSSPSYDVLPTSEPGTDEANETNQGKNIPMPTRSHILRARCGLSTLGAHRHRAS